MSYASLILAIAAGGCTIVLAVVVKSWESILFAIFFCACMAVALVRSRILSEEALLRRQDKLMETKDDPKEIARWVP
jgi:protein-S-isoprenylcysteine O-methyltransferase Ste14